MTSIITISNRIGTFTIRNVIGIITTVFVIKLVLFGQWPEEAFSVSTASQRLHPSVTWSRLEFVNSYAPNIQHCNPKKKK